MTITQKQDRLAALLKARAEARAELTASQADDLWDSVSHEHALIEEIEELSDSIALLQDSIDFH